MDALTLLGVAVALGVDAFVVALAISSGINSLTSRHTFRLTWHFGLFQSLMTFLGWLGGKSVAKMFCGLNNWIAGGLLVFVGLKMLKESWDDIKPLEGFDRTRGWSLVGLSIATSLDALAVGISLSLIRMRILSPVLVIGVTASLMTLLGMMIGNNVGKSLGMWAERAGATVLTIIGVRMLIQAV
ncbi:MAG: manganese efflux pump MntP family protein [Desulfomonilaceae bacterium]